MGDGLNQAKKIHRVKRIIVKYEHSDGQKVDLGLQLFTALQCVKSLVTANPIEVSKYLELKPTAAVNRLERLRKMGFVDREQDPNNLKANRYFLANTNGKQPTK